MMFSTENPDVGIWIRVSTEDQADGESPKNHEARARMYAEFKKWHVVDLYDLSGVSGKSVIEHPEARRMLLDVKTGKIKALIFSKLARLARNVRELLEISDHFQKYGAHLVSIGESIDTSSPAGRLLFTVIGALAQWEREETSARVAASVPVRAKLGKPIGGKGPFGYMWVDRRLVVNPAEAPIVRELFSTFLKTKKLLVTARNMNSMGYRTRQGAKYGKTTVKRILTDPTHKGTRRANYSKSKGDGKSWLLKPESDWVYHDVEPIVSEEVWKEVNAIIKTNAAPFPSARPCLTGIYTFSGLLYCRRCDKKMYVMKYPGMTIPRYICRCCKAKINEDIIMEQFKNGLRCMSVDPTQLRGIHEDSEKLVHEKEQQIISLQAEIKPIDKKIDSVIDLFSDGAINKKLLTDKIAELQKRKQQLIKTIPALEGEIAFIKASTLHKDRLLSKVQSISSLWDSLNHDDEIKLVKELLSKVILDKHSLTFNFFYLSDFIKQSINVSDSCTPDQMYAPADISAIGPGPAAVPSSRCDSTRGASRAR